MDACARFRTLLAQGDGAGSLTAEAEAHLAGCPVCRSLWDAYLRAVAQYREAGAVDPVQLPDPAVVLAAARARTRRRLRVARATAMAAVLALVIGALILSRKGSDTSGLPTPGGEGFVRFGPDAPVLELTGDASLVGQEDQIAAGAREREVAEGGVVRTGEGYAELSDGRTARVSLAPRTRLRVEQWRGARSLLVLEEGGVEAQVNSMVAGETFEVLTPLARVRVIGTRFIVMHHLEGGTEVLGLEGEVTVEDVAGRLVARLTAGRSVRLGTTVPVPREEAGVHGIGFMRETPTPLPGVGRTGGDPIVPDELVSKARRLLAEGRDDEALRVLQEAVEASRTGVSARVLGALADAYRLAGRPSEAAATWERSLVAGPGPAPETAYLDYAELLDAQDRPADAARVRESYLKAWPSGRHLGQALRDLIAFAEKDGRPEDARALRVRLLQEAPRSKEAVDVLVEQGLRLARAGRLEEAAGWFEGRLDSGSRELTETAWVGLMRIRFDQGRWQDVRFLADEYRQRFPVGARRDEVARLVQALPAASGSGPR